MGLNLGLRSRCKAIIALFRETGLPVHYGFLRDANSSKPVSIGGFGSLPVYIVESGKRLLVCDIPEGP